MNVRGLLLAKAEEVGPGLPEFFDPCTERQIDPGQVENKAVAIFVARPFAPIVTTAVIG